MNTIPHLDSVLPFAKHLIRHLTIFFGRNHYEKKRTPDERVVAQYRQVNSEALTILIVALILSIIVQSIFLKTPLSQYLGELIMLLVVGGYLFVRYLVIGLNVSMRPSFMSLAVALIVTCLNGFSNFHTYKNFYSKTGMVFLGAVLIVTFISSFLIPYFIFKIMHHINQKRQNAIQKKLDQREEL
ncbi:DUF6773 family protein [Pediococcus siamensis]|uniref:DUF6773 family protein n=1 Tax=Pediococcus siamensis TaxID=381829 RepID=UPI0039A0A0EC